MADYLEFYLITNYLDYFSGCGITSYYHAIRLYYHAITFCLASFIFQLSLILKQQRNHNFSTKTIHIEQYK